MPGTPITNLGTRTTHPNVDDVLTETWDASKGRWQETRYDSGWRNVSSLLTADWAIMAGGGYLRLRRVGQRVELTGQLTRVSATAANLSAQLALITLPAGFAPTASAYNVIGQALHADATVPGGALSNQGATDRADVLFPGATTVWAAGQTFMVSMGAWTTNARPTSLPGTPHLPAPN
jgi:hypothetical protein